MRIIIVLIVAFFSPYAAGQVAERPFERQMYAVERLDYHDPIRSSSLSKKDRRGLLGCRGALMAVLSGVVKTADIRLYLTPELARMYPTSEALAEKIIAPETTVLAVGVREFDFDEFGGIRLKFFALVFAEGENAVPQMVASCREVGGRWRISEFEFPK